MDQGVWSGIPIFLCLSRSLPSRLGCATTAKTQASRLCSGVNHRDDMTRQLRHSAMCAIGQLHRVLVWSQTRSCGVHHIFPPRAMPAAQTNLDHFPPPPWARPYRDVRNDSILSGYVPLRVPTRTVNKANFPTNANRMRNPVTDIQPELAIAHRVTSDDNIEQRNNNTNQ
jgi:hypothetical protein